MSKYIDKIKEHFPGASINSAYGMCPGGFFKFGMREDIPDCTGDCALCWNAEAPEDEVYCDRGEYDIPEDWCATPADYCVMGNKKIPAAPAEAAAPAQNTFDYSELDADTAAKLENVTAEIFNVRKEYIFTMAKKVAYAHDLLANCGNGKFGAWCESVGISRFTGNNLVRIVELFNNSTTEEQMNLNKLTDGNVKLLYEAAKPSAPPELVEQVKSGDITTHKEYIKIKKELESQKQLYSKVHDENQELRRDRVNAMNRADNAERELSDAKAEIEKLNREADEADREYDAMADRECHYETEICELKHQIKELEAQPRDVAIQLDEETLAKKDQEISELKEEILRMNDKNIKSFIIRMSLDEYDLLLNALEPADDRLKNIIKNARIFRI